MMAKNSKLGKLFQKFQTRKTLESWNTIRFTVGYNTSGKNVRYCKKRQNMVRMSKKLSKSSQRKS